MAQSLRNVLFIMCDQLRADHLACSGHPWLSTPNLDAVAARGVRFSRAFANSGVCGPSRASFYTGRYPISHGTTWNALPFSVAQSALGHRLDPAGRKVHLAGKSHVVPDSGAIERLGMPAERARFFAAGGFTEWDRHDGHSEPAADAPYAAYLRSRGYRSDAPWNDFVVSTHDADGNVRSGWAMRNVVWPARVAARDSETAYMTRRAVEFIEQAGAEPWVLHLSYVKPHWPYVAPAPYHALYARDQCLPVVREPAELEHAHPAIEAYRRHAESRAFRRNACIDAVRPVYQGLIHQVDEALGAVMELLERRNLASCTLVVFTADHGDLLGDHWLGEKELFYECVQRIPLIVCDPRPEADGTRGGEDDRLVEAIDVLPTVLDALGIPASDGSIEGTSLVPVIHGRAGAARDAVFSELDYAFRPARRILRVAPEDARAFSLRTRRWRYVYWRGLPEQLFDLEADPHELHDLGRDAITESLREGLRRRLLDVLASRRPTGAASRRELAAHARRSRSRGIRIGEW